MSDKPDYLVDVPAEYISADEYEAQEVVQQEQVVQITDWEQTMSQLAERKATSITIPRGAGFNRAQIVQAFDNAFHLIGGTPRLALWADENPKEFFKLYAKLLPSQSTSSLGESTDIIIKHILPKSPLDE
tara:strand:- start:2876 stop:3265 length:390 start_codon:yes stop_codon:yes gene_type:complete